MSELEPTNQPEAIDSDSATDDSDTDSEFEIWFPVSPYEEGPPFTRAEFPPLPDGALEDDCYYFLGWPDNEKTWERAMVGVTGNPNVVRPRKGSALGAVIVHRFFWKEVVQYPHFWFFDELEVPPSYFDKPRTLLSRTPDGGPERTNIVAICASHDAHLQGCRPTQEQYDFVVELFEEEPVWYKDRTNKRNWDICATPEQPMLDWYDQICHDCRRPGIARNTAQGNETPRADSQSG